MRKDIPVKKIMGTPVRTIEADNNMAEAAKKLKDLNIGALMVVEDDEYVGIVSERDFVYKIAAEEKEPKNTIVAEVMTSEVTYAHENDSVQDCYEMMAEHKFRHLPIKNDDDVVGLVSIRSIFSVRDDTKQFMIDQLKQYIQGER